MFKQLIKTTSWENISRAEYGTTDRANDLEKLNNNKTDGKIIVYNSNLKASQTGNLTTNPKQNQSTTSSQNPTQNSTQNQPTASTQTNKNKSEITIKINNIEIKSFLSIDLINSITDIKSAILHLHRIDNINLLNDCEIYYNNEIFLKGCIKNIMPILNAGNIQYALQIKSYVGILLDSVVQTELQFRNASLKEIVNSVCKIYNIDVEFNISSNRKDIIEYKLDNEIDNSITTRLNETAWSFITRLCNSRGLMIQDTGNNKIKIFNITNRENNSINNTNNTNNSQSKAKHSFIFNDSTITNWMPIYNYDNLARYYEVYTQFNTNSKELITLDPIKLPITKRLINNEINAGILKDFAKWMIYKDIRQAVKLQITINGNLNELNVNDRVIVKNEFIGFKEETEMLIETKVVNYPNATILVLTMSFENMERLPFLNN